MLISIRFKTTKRKTIYSSRRGGGIQLSSLYKSEKRVKQEKQYYIYLFNRFNNLKFRVMRGEYREKVKLLFV